MPQYPPPRRLRTDNIKRVLSRRTAEELARALGMVRGRSGLWPENDPEAYAAYLRDLLNDPRSRRTRADASLPIIPTRVCGWIAALRRA